MEPMRLNLWAPHLHRPYPGHGRDLSVCLETLYIYIYIYKFGMVGYFYTLFLKEGSLKLQVNKFGFLPLTTYLLEKV